MKQRWDAVSERTRWLHDDEKRVQDERREAFGQYLAARPSLARVMPLIEGTRRGRRAEIESVAEPFRLAGARLLIVVQERRDIAVIESDLELVEAWLSAVAADAWRAQEMQDLGGAEEILALARRLHAPACGPMSGRWRPLRRARSQLVQIDNGVSAEQRPG